MSGSLPRWNTTSLYCLSTCDCDARLEFGDLHRAAVGRLAQGLKRRPNGGSVTKLNTSVSVGCLPAARSVASRARSRPHVASPARDVGGGRRAARRPSWRATRTGALGGGQTLQPANHRPERLQTPWDKMAAAPRQPRPNRGAVTLLARERRPHFLA